ncbi:MAG: hypothetical protein C4520_20115 [Candidatus Abyssobacteria bacterium SURF_5]|uniref:Uncharacterized protein n=1 Tax=Abyssobacteria bacterium (strain SURF_5) TaxID=2093360 RepID=A0A3A4N0E7_ABYX5|nr:MAG: hypothetical protein C4520_20115 [Candidatus Abyssubacteria bacterium SURF_5]
MICSIGKIKEKDLDEIKELEEELGKTILAFQCSHKMTPAELKEDELERLRKTEEKLHLTLVAVDH